RSLGWHRGDKDSDERHALRQAFVPLVARTDPKLGAEAEKLADGWLANRSGVDDDLVDPVLVIAAQRGDANRFERYLATARHARDRSEQQRVLGALGVFRDPALVSRAQDIVLGHEFDLRDTLRLLYAELYRRETRDLALDFV